MSNDIATISLRVNTGDLERGNQALDKFQDTAAAAAGKADDLNSSFKAGASTQKQNTESLKQQRQELQNLLNKISPVNKALDELDTIQANLAKFRGKGLVGDEDYTRYNSVLETTRSKLAQVMESETAEGRARIEQAQATQRAAAAGKSFIASLEEQASAIGKTRTEMLELKAAQLGVSQQAAPMLAKLKEQEKAWQSGATSAGQYRNAMRMLPAQLTDIATQLAGGQSPFLILLQQGGQIKDSFGGVGNTLKILLTYLNPTTATLGLATLAFSGLAVAVYKARQEIDEANLAVKDTLGMSGEHASKLALNIRAIADASGDSIKNVTSLFISTKDGADEAVQKMLSVGISYQDAKTKIAEYKGSSDFTSINESIEAHRRQVLGIPDAWSSAAEAVKNYYTGADQGKQSVALGGATDPIIATIERAKALREGLNKATIEGNLAVKDSVDWINKEYLAADSVANAEERLRKAREQSRKIAFSGDKEAIANAQQLIALRQREVTDAIKQRDKKDNPKSPAVKVDAGDRTVENYQAQARTLTDTLERLRQTGDAQAKNTELSKQQSRFAELEEAAKTRALTTQEKSILANREAISNAAKVVDQKNKEVEAQQKINGLAQQANKYVTQMAEKTDALRDSAGLSGRQTQRLMEEAQLRQGWLNGGGKLEDAGYEKELAALRNYYAEEDKLRGDWKAGAVSGWNEYLDAATNTYDAVKNVASSTLTGLSDMLTELMTTGKASVKEFGKSMLKMILEVTNRLMVAYAVQAAMGWISGGTGGGSTPGGAYASAASGMTFNAKGGVYESSGLSRYVNGVYDSPQYFTFQGASKFAKGGVFAEAGAEAIMPLTRDSAGRLGVRAQGGGGAQPQVNIDIYVDNKGNTSSTTSGDGSDAARALGKEIEAKVTEVLVRAARSDGFLGKTFQPK
ncbi:TPA: phage tail tape measure protein [Kluyvera ascorbata]|uniref:phage tail tape measure protein n=1 Tax=Kluyvera ascorbata TaxID=51288 RepID=UPI0028A12547|nr:phage tail tape measure protein [Kluyvera ascorbata]MEB6390896.1 phage tail tape measure protein [Kluyvera ascorbata]